MPEKPLLLFPHRAKASYSGPQGGADKEIKRPGKIKQMGRVQKIFERLHTAFENQKAQVDITPDGMVPELVLVFETRGSITDFFRAVSKIPELKWLGEYEDDYDASDEFYYKDSDRALPGKIFFMLADARAIQELQSLWRVWVTKKQRFSTGYAKWKALFDLLVNIREWNVNDRIAETGLLSDWQERVVLNEEVIPFEIELWFRKSRNQRTINRDRIKSLIEENGGRIINESVIEDISYHGILVEAPIGIFDSIVQNSPVTLFKSSDVMFFRPVGQTILRTGEADQIEDNSAVKQIPDQFQRPIVGLLDGMPVQNHKYLQGRIDLFDPDNFEENYPVNERHHCTGMASIIIHGDIASNNEPIKSKILIRPVMKFHPFGQGGEEYIPEDTLLIDLIHRAVKQISDDFKDDNGNSSIKVINLSLGDKFRIFDTIMSPWARLLDWLSFKYNLLFVVSAGNCLENIEFAINNGTFDEFLTNSQNLRSSTINLFYTKNRHRKIYSPAEAVNALTVGSCNADNNSEFDPNQRIQLYDQQGYPSPISRMGLGYRKSIKPEILAPGGRILFRKVGGTSLGIAQQTILPPGITVASPGLGGNRVSFTKGTSNAAAMISHSIIKIFENLQETPNLRESLTGEYFPVVAKALATHSASWKDEDYQSIVDSIPGIQNRKVRETVSRFLGYGATDISRVLECTEKRVTIIGCQSLLPESAYIYDLPLPNELGSTTAWRKLTVTLAWLSPINTMNQKYRTHKLWFEFPGGDLEQKFKAKRLFYDDDAVRRGTLQHEIFHSNKAVPLADNSSLKIKVNCKTDAEAFDDVTYREIPNRKAIRYALIVTLEIDPQINIDIYQRIQNRIQQVVVTP